MAEIIKSVIAAGGEWARIKENLGFSQSLGRFSPTLKINFPNLYVFLQGTWIPAAGKPTSQHTDKRGY